MSHAVDRCSTMNVHVYNKTYHISKLRERERKSGRGEGKKGEREGGREEGKSGEREHVLHVTSIGDSSK